MYPRFSSNRLRTVAYRSGSSWYTAMSSSKPGPSGTDRERVAARDEADATLAPSLSAPRTFPGLLRSNAGVSLKVAEIHGRWRESLGILAAKAGEDRVIAVHISSASGRRLPGPPLSVLVVIVGRPPQVHPAQLEQTP